MKVMEINKIYCESNLDTLKKMSDNSIDCVITSPPYWQLRDYGYDGQWGLEPTFNEYLENLWSMMDEIYRVLKETGTVWINLGDTYARATKCLLLIPHRFAIGCIERGWILRNDIVWAKPNGMPESCKDRFTKKHEYFFFMVKSEKYYFDLDAIRDPIKEVSLERYKYNFTGQEGGGSNNFKGNKSHLIGNKPQYSVLDANYRNQIIETRNLPSHDNLRNYLSDSRKLKNITIQKIEEIFGNHAPHHWFEKNGSYPSAEDWVKLKNILKFDDLYDKQLTNIEFKSGIKQNNPLGKNPGDVSDFWAITTKPSSNEHYASYNEELIRKPILAGCPENGIIYDPFMGTGSTAESALRSNRKYIGSEMNEKYIEIANKRLEPFMKQTKLF